MGTGKFAPLDGRVNAVVIDTSDNVATVLAQIDPGEQIAWAGDSEEVTTVLASEAIPAGHKVAIGDIATGESIRKYGNTIGRASTGISTGSHVHTHNLTGQEI